MELASIMRREEKGDFTVLATLDGQYEIAMLGNRFNHMLGQQEIFICKLISMANKMGMIGDKLAIIMSESKTTLPGITNELIILILACFIYKGLIDAICWRTSLILFIEGIRSS